LQPIRLGQRQIGYIDRNRVRSFVDADADNADALGL